jgi:YHS domain-containing protein
MTVSADVEEANQAAPPAINREVIARLLHDRPALALDGNDPVVLIDSGNVVLGLPSITSRIDGQTYQFSSQETKARFEERPAAYLPALAGDSIVAWVDRKVLEPGSIKQHTVYGGTIYLFSSTEDKQKFDNDPKMYADGDLLLQGFSPVSLVDDETLRRGSKDFEVKLDGWRIFLVDADEVQKFGSNPGRYFPTLAGIDPLSAAEGNPAVGLARYSVVYKNRLYALASSENREKFIANAEPYSDFDVAAKGNDPVALTDDKEERPGHYGISSVYRGRRYLFVNDENRQKFLEEPTKYVH